MTQERVHFSTVVCGASHTSTTNSQLLYTLCKIGVATANFHHHPNPDCKTGSRIPSSSSSRIYRLKFPGPHHLPRATNPRPETVCVDIRSPFFFFGVCAFPKIILQRNFGFSVRLRVPTHTGSCMKFTLVTPVKLHRFHGVIFTLTKKIERNNF